MLSRRALAIGLATVVLGAAAVTGPDQAAGADGAARPGGRTAAAAASAPATSLGRAAGQASSRPCAALPGARQLPGADGVTPAAWSGGGLVVPVCGPVPGDGDGARGTPVYAYPGAQWTPGYQCVEFSERYLYDRYGVTMDILTNGDQVAAHYAAGFPGLFMIIGNGTPDRAPRPGDVLSLSAVPGFDSASGGHTAVVQSSSVDAAGNGTVTIVEENAAASGVAVLTVAGWTVRYPGFRYLEWLTSTGQPVTLPRPAAGGASGYSPK
jgi:CHAP domain